MKRLLTAIATIGFAIGAGPAHAVVDTTFTAVGLNAAAIQPTVDSFRTALGALNSPDPVNNPDGRREINWDAAPGTVADPNPFPGDFFNGAASPRARGLTMSPVGIGGFGISSDPADSGTNQPAPPLFTLGPFGFQTFSDNRIFAVFGTNQFDVFFRNPALPSQQAVVDGFGAVFVDVDDPGSRLDFFGLSDNLLASVDVPDQRVVTPDGTLSFAGATFTSPEVARVRVTLGASGLESCGLTSDCVAMDDFIYGEPQAIPLPASALLALIGPGIGVLMALRQRRTAK
jgi:hypothetical protein